MRRSFDGLQALTRHAMGHDPLDGSLYVFVSRRGAQMRVLYFDRSGFCVWGKRLETENLSAMGTAYTPAR
jgi:transposase